MAFRSPIWTLLQQIILASFGQPITTSIQWAIKVSSWSSSKKNFSRPGYDATCSHKDSNILERQFMASRDWEYGCSMQAADLSVMQALEPLVCNAQCGCRFPLWSWTAQVVKNCTLPSKGVRYKAWKGKSIQDIPINVTNFLLYPGFG